MVSRWQADAAMAGPPGGAGGDRALARALDTFLVRGLGGWGRAEPGGAQTFTVTQDRLGPVCGWERSWLCRVISYGRRVGLIHTTRVLDPETGYLGVNTYHVRSLAQWKAWRAEHRPRSNHVHSTAHHSDLDTDSEPWGPLGWYGQTVDSSGWTAPTPSPYVIPVARSPEADAAMESARAIRDQLPARRARGWGRV